MKAIHRKQRFLVIAASITAIACLAGYFVITGMRENADQRLTEAQIEALRDEYPICGTSAPATISILPPSLEEIRKRADTFVYGTVTGEPTDYLVSASTGDTELDEKRAANDLDNVYTFYEYPVTVISDTGGLYEKGQEITIAASKELADYNPRLSPGMKIVVPVAAEENTSRAQFTVHGMYYVTKDGYVLSAYQEEAAPEKQFSGAKVEVLLQELKKP